MTKVFVKTTMSFLENVFILVISTPHILVYTVNMFTLTSAL